jgi:hypothetical protein
MPLGGVLVMVLALLFKSWCEKLEGSGSRPSGLVFMFLVVS